MNEEAKEALDLRLARGEISPKEYSRTLALLSENAGPNVPPKESARRATEEKGGSSGRWKVLAVIVLTVCVLAAILRQAYVTHEKATDSINAGEETHSAGLLRLAQQERERAELSIRQGQTELGQRMMEKAVLDFQKHLWAKGIFDEKAVAEQTAVFKQGIVQEPKGAAK